MRQFRASLLIPPGFIFWNRLATTAQPCSSRSGFCQGSRQPR